MNPYELIRQQISKTVPFAQHAGIELVSIEDGKGEARLEQSASSINHIGSQHAGALFTLGEAASGAAMAGALAPVLLKIRPVAATAQIAFTKIAKGTIRAVGKSSQPGPQLLSLLDRDGRVSFGVDVILTDEAGDQVCTMTVDWYVRSTG